MAPHAAGVAYAVKLRKEPRGAVCMFGDGRTSKGDVYEAGVHKLPVVFVATNNQWAISVPLFPQGSSHLGEPPSPAPQELDRHRPLIS